MTDKQDPIAHAARLLREAAEELRQAHAYNNSEGWENETDAKAAYDEHLAAAQALEDWEQAVGAGGVSGPLVGRASLSANAGEPRKVFLVATGEEHEGEATYTRYDDKPPPLCDSECLFAAQPTAQAEGWTKPHRTITYTCPVCAASLERQE